MSEPRREASENDRELARWLDRVREGYAPPEPTPAQRAAFDARLRARLERPPRAARWLPVSIGAGLAAAAVAALLVLRTPAVRTPAAPVTASDDWADAVLLDDGSAYGEGGDAEDALPPAYAAIASAWLE
jgi:hypothetical protein